jgi:hypothetical protein
MSGALLLASLVSPILLGLAFAAPLGRALPRDAPGRVLFASTALALGLGATSCAFFVWSWLVDPRSAWVVEAILAGGAALGGFALYRRRARDRERASVSHPASLLVVVAFVAVALAALGSFFAVSRRNPHGAWDAWMTWNAHARFMFRGGAEWLVMFSDQTSLRHPDYPFLLPSLVARGWSYVDGEWLVVPVAVALLYTALTAAIAWAAVATMTSRTHAYLAAMLLLGTPFFVAHGASQYADIPVGLYLLAAVALVTLHDRRQGEGGSLLVLAGAAAGMSAWTKNEGLLFIAALVIARAIVVLPVGGVRALVREAGSFALGLLPVLAVVLAFKVNLAPPNDLMSGEAQGAAQTLQRLADGDRHAYVARSVAAAVWEFGRNRLAGVLVVLAVAGVALGVRRGSFRDVKMGLLTILLVMTGHVLAYLTAPADMPRLLEGSIDRLLLQLWPTAVFVFFLGVRSPDLTDGSDGRVATSPTPPPSPSAAR